MNWISLHQQLKQWEMRHKWKNSRTDNRRMGKPGKCNGQSSAWHDGKFQIEVFLRVLRCLDSPHTSWTLKARATMASLPSDTIKIQARQACFVLKTSTMDAAIKFA